MAKLEGVFNSEDVPAREEFTPIPPGAYTAMIVASELKDTQKGGQMIVLELDIQGGENAGRKLFERLNIKNDNPKAVDIAFRTLGEIVKAVGKTTIKDTEELHNKRMTINVKVSPAKPYTKDGVEHPGQPQNEITRFLPYAAGATPVTTQTVSADSPSKPNVITPVEAQDSLPPWKRKKGV
jgi:hypothetical protein